MKLTFLHSDIISQIFDYLDPISIASLSCTCKKFAALGMTCSSLAISRFKVDQDFHQKRLDLGELHESSWQQLYKRLDAGLTGYKGFALDLTAREMYEMELVITASKQKKIRGIVAAAIAEEGCDIRNLQSVYLNELEGFIRWRSSSDEDEDEEEEQGNQRPPSLGALTLVQGSIIDKSPVARFVKDPLLNKLVARHIIFEEYYLAKGRGIAIPNRYYGILDGCLISGSFDPAGGEEMKGVFILVMEESLTHLPPLFAPKQVWIGGIADTLNAKSPFICRLVVETILGSDLQGTLQVDTSKPFTSCRLRKDKQKIYSFRFTACVPAAIHSNERDRLPQIALTNVLFTPISIDTSPASTPCILEDADAYQSSCHVIPSFPITLYRIGPLLFSLFLNPTPTIMHINVK